MSAEIQATAAGRLLVRLDALDAALTAFEPRKLDTLIALRRQIEFVLLDARAAGLTELTGLAAQACSAGVLDVQQSSRALIVALRRWAGKNRRARNPEFDLIDPATGLMRRDAFAKLFTSLAHQHPHIAVAAIELPQAATLRQKFGPEAAARLNTHVGATLARIIRDHDCVASFEPDHFTIFLPGEDARGLKRAMARIEAALTQHPFNLPDGTSEQLNIVISGRLLDRNAADTVAADEAPCVGIHARSAATAKVIESRLRNEGFRPVIAPATRSARGKIFGDEILEAVLIDAAPKDIEELVEAVRSNLASRRAPILVITGDDDETRIALEAGATDVLRRPLDLEAATRALRRLIRRDLPPAPAPDNLQPDRLLIVSSDLYPLISIGTAMQRSVGCDVHLSRGAADAIVRFREHRPAAVLLDLRLQHHATHELLHALAAEKKSPQILLIIEEYERTRATAITEPLITGVIVKPLHLLTLADEVRKATGLTASERNDSAALLNSEIARVMQPATKTS